MESNKKTLTFLNIKMELHPIAKIIVEKGLKQADVSMFDDKTKKEIYSQAAEFLKRQNRNKEALVAMALAGEKIDPDALRQIVDNLFETKRFREAHDLLVAAGDEKMAELVRVNFLS